MKYKLINLPSNNNDKYVILDEVTGKTKPISRDQLVFLVGQDKIDGITGQLNKDKVIIRGLEKQESNKSELSKSETDKIKSSLDELALYILDRFDYEGSKGFKHIFVRETDIKYVKNKLTGKIMIYLGFMKNTCDFVEITLDVDNKTGVVKKIDLNVTSGKDSLKVTNIVKNMNNIDDVINLLECKWSVNNKEIQTIVNASITQFNKFGVFINELDTSRYYFPNVKDRTEEIISKYTIENIQIKSKVYHYFFVMINAMNCEIDIFDAYKDNYKPYSPMKRDEAFIEFVNTEEVQARVGYSLKDDRESFIFASYDVVSDNLTVCVPEINSEEYKEYYAKFSELTKNNLYEMLRKGFKAVYKFHTHTKVKGFIDKEHRKYSS